MKLYLIRHGQSVTNLQKRHTGQYQAHLTGQGEADAVRAGKVLRGIPFDKVYTSDLVRAMRTCELALPDTPYEATALIREVDVGSLELKPIDTTGELYGEEYMRCRRQIDYKPYGGEDYTELRARVQNFLDTVAASGCERTAAFCHGGVVAMMLDIASGTRIDRGGFCCDNGSVTVLEYISERWRIVTWNYTGEL